MIFLYLNTLWITGTQGSQDKGVFLPNSSPTACGVCGVDGHLQVSSRNPVPCEVHKITGLLRTSFFTTKTSEEF